MASLSSWPGPDSLSRCFTLVRWLHANGISWSGTAAELTAQLRLDSDALLWFSNSEELVAFLESNDDAFRQLGLESSIRKIPGRPRLIELHIADEAEGLPKSGPVEVAAPSSELSQRVEELPVPSTIEELPKVEEQRRESLLLPAEPVEPAKVPTSEPVTRLYSLLGLSPEEVAEDRLPARLAERKEQISFGGYIEPDQDSLRSRLLPILIVAIVTVILAVAVVALMRRGSSNRAAQPVVTNGESTETAPSTNLDPVEAKKANALLQQASTSKNASAQFELAMCYKTGRGVAIDNAAALAWLNLARANGDTRAQAEIRSLSPQISTADAQNARIAIGKAFVAGTSVPRNYVIAHNWFSVAELAGSSEASTLRKQIETKMTGGQLQRARSSGR